MWKELWTSLLITPVTTQMSRFSTGLHKVWAVRMMIYINNLHTTRGILAIFRRFLRSCKLLEKNVPFSHLTTVFFHRHFHRPVAVRTATAILLFSLLSSPVPAAGAEPLPLEELTARTQELYDRTTDLKARFVQEVTIQSMKKTEREEGTVFFKNPRMMLWDYLKPKTKKLVINAQKAWLYVPEDRIVYVQSSEALFRSRVALRFLSGLGKLSEDFQVRFAKDKPLDDRGNYLLLLTAREPGTGLDRLNLTVDGRTFLIIQCWFNDAFGNTTRLRFSDTRLNTGIPDHVFTFKPPEGVEVVNMTQ